jgi:acyl carrier protein
MSSEELKEQIKEMLITNLMLRTPKEEITDDLPLFGPDGLGLDSIDALHTIHDYILAQSRKSDVHGP